jgi:A/G-specific adenine glycosylase
VATVIPYYKRFLSRYPTVEALAAAPLDDVLKAWEGLGYYSRARNLHRAARQVVEQWGGQFPSSIADLMALPGIGRYTAGAVASFAFGVHAPVLDGNVIRIFSRLFDLSDEVSQPVVRARLWELADDLLPEGRAAAWNEGLMELGRRVCIPGMPRCAECPLAARCLAFARQTQHQRPVKAPRKRLPHYDVTAAVISGADGRLLIAQRPLDKMMGGLWEFPGGKREHGESLPACLQREIREELGVEIAVGQQVATIKHTYTHFQITLYVFACQHLSGEPQTLGCLDWAWVGLDEIERYAFPSIDRKIIAALRNGGGQLAFDLSG